MKKILATKIILLLTLLSMIIIQFNNATALQCISSSDDYASEVVLNKPEVEYNLNYLANAKNVIFRDNKYTYVSHYNNNLLVIISEIKDDNYQKSGLSVKIQMPTISSKENVHVLNLISKSSRGKIIPENVTGATYDGWNIGCSNERIISECKFSREGVVLTASLNEDSYDIELEVSNSQACDSKCDGYCVRSGGESTCINNKTKYDIENVLKHAGLIKNFNEFISAYNIKSNGIIPINSITTQLDGDIDWKKALREELLWLKGQDIIRILNDDIDKASSLAKRGASGNNERIVYAKNKMGVAGWVYYDESIEPVISFTKECSEYIISPGITGGVTFDTVSSRTYYLIPVFAVIIIILIFFLVIVFTRWNHERLKNQRNDIEKEISKIK